MTDWGTLTLVGGLTAICALGFLLHAFCHQLLPLTRGIDAFTGTVGRLSAWCILGAVIVSAGNALSRYLLNISSDASLQLQWILFSAAFLLGGAWTLATNQHIRIDIVNSRLSPVARRWVDIIGHLFFLLPLTLVMLFYAMPFLLNSFAEHEQSNTPARLLLWPAKSLIVAAFALLLLQAISETIKCFARSRESKETDT